ncbi:cell division protein FtsA [Rhabdobacter roseus]|uniref:Cell division protein FtsA n=1 Tax=Rhabdobacter roseus TaxID=1655419 RepID=A0A840TY44_9BACT|nr:cell division protein FtsA [Rhabdobacter roseus]MBB5284810.1 cell division protein FtsA [Rhabdobacter roseus]
MVNDTIVAGVDIGSTKVSVVVAQSSGGYRSDTIEIMGFSEVPVAPGAVVNGSVENIRLVGDALRTALQELDTHYDLDISVVNVSFGGMHVKVSNQSDGVIRPTSSTGDEVTQRDVDQLVDDMYRAKTESNYDVMHVLPMDFIVDGAPGVREPVGRTGIKLGGNFLVVSANNQSIQRTKKSLSEAKRGLYFDKMLLAPIATGLAVLEEEEMNAGIALVDIGDHTTDLVIYHEGIIRHIASFPIAGKHLTADLRIGCGIQLENAEELKKEFGQALSEDVPLTIEILVNYLTGRAPKQVLKKNVAMIIEERLKEIAAMVYAEILQSGYADELIGGIVLTGGTANIPEIETLFSRVADDMPVRVGIPEHLARTPKADAVSNTSYATALGLAWAGLKPIDVRVKSVCKPADVPVPTPVVKEPKKPRKDEGGGFWRWPLPGRRDSDNLGEYE